MTTEEIEKAIERFTEERRHKSTGYPPKEWFKAGVEFTDKHWQEKTRWRSLEKEPPKFEGQKYEVLVRYSPGIHDIVCIVGLRSVERAISAGYKDWKEIE